jgi:hypothetical protein
MENEDVVAALIEHQGTLYSEEMGAELSRNTPQELFHWLIGSIMLSARVRSGNAVRACKALRENDLHRIDRILGCDYWDLVRVLNENGYARYDESTARYLKDTARWARDAYDGDIRRIHDTADSAQAIFDALQGAKGLGPMGAKIFAREAQLVWDAFFPMADGPALEAASDLGLPKDTKALNELAGSRERFVRLIAALTRGRLEGFDASVKEVAA